MRSLARQRLHGTEQGCSSSGSSQNKLPGIGKQARGCGNSCLKPGEAARAIAIAPRAGPAFGGGWLRRMLCKAQRSHPAQGSLKMQQNGNEANAQQDASDSCHQTGGTNLVPFCHSDSGDGDPQIAPRRRTRLACSLPSPLLSLLSPYQKPCKKTSIGHLVATYTPLGAEHPISPHQTRLSRSQQQFQCVPQPSR